ncbi:MAG: hypothetical protein WCL02_05635 [bacterium]
MNAWKNFFKDNLQTILRPDVIADTFGSQYKIDLSNIEKNKPQLDPWEEAAQLLDRQDSNNYINVGRTNEEKLQLRNKKKLFTNSNTKYIN